VATERSDTDRAAWGDLIDYLPVKDLVFVDECGSNIALTHAMRNEILKSCPLIWRAKATAHWTLRS
jgi:hypothetical protein